MTEVTWLTTDSTTQVTQLLQELTILPRDASLTSLVPAGEGNMNVTLRAIWNESSVIVKQSRPFVAKYDFIPAPVERIEFESAFYEAVQGVPQLSAHMPQRLGWLPEQHVLILEDLGASADATDYYTSRSHEQFIAFSQPLLAWLADLHRLPTEGVDGQRFRNRKLRELNHAHIFEIPFQATPAIDLDAVCPGLEAASRRVRTSGDVQRRSRELGALYLSDGTHLLHGDFYPGSWLRTTRGPMVIDPEFCFLGPAEFDMGVFIAHAQMIGLPDALQLVRQHYASSDESVDWALVQQFAAIEVLRRLLGVAQLPLQIDLPQRTRLIETAHATLRGITNEFSSESLPAT